MQLPVVSPQVSHPQPPPESGVETTMMTQNQTQANRTRALWIIAISLVIIAACLVLIVLKLHLQKSASSAVSQEPEVAVVAPEPENFSSPPTRPTNSSPRRPTPTVAHIPIPPILEPAAPAPEVAPVEVLPEPRVAVVSRATHPGNTIIGRVTLRGTPPPERAIALNSTPSCPALQTNPPTTQDFIVGTNGEFANVFVSLAGRVNTQPSAASLTNRVLTLAECKMTPLLSGALTTQALRFSNRSAEDHTVKITMTNYPASQNLPASYNVNLYPGVTRNSPTIRRPEDFISIECAQHPWEFAYVCVVENPFFAVSDTNGGFVIPNVPTGKYLINARHLRLSGPNSLSREVIVKADQPTVLDFTFDMAASQ
jgi:hypothetical protein